MPSDLASPTEKSIETPFEVAKEVLSLIGKFRTPPIPEVYEVWYRYVDGQSDAVKEQLDYALRDLGEVTLERLLGIKEQFLCSSSFAELNKDVTSKLGVLTHQMQSTIDSKKAVLDEFESQLDSTCSLLVENQSSENVREVVADIRAESTRVSGQISEMVAQLGDTSTELKKLRKQVEELQASVLSDPLTGVGNRRKFEQELQKILASDESVGNTYLFMIDLDKFKEINDTFGHSAGDLTLQFVSKALEEHIPNATVCRFGGDEFAVFASLPTEDVMMASEELCNYFAVNEVTMESDGKLSWRVTISGGAAIYRVDDSSESLKSRADKLLYSAKTSGRKKILVERENSRAKASG
ncbi:MAG: GGDEF domain-containing protein [Pirellula sp.]|jgi:diguanylate cyclase|nr:GGDEF domain-containing protein [Pirellula sp.]